jgi:hypothetical protein
VAQTTVEEFAKDVDRYLTAAQKERIIVTRNGEPLALVVGMENKDAEDFHYMTSPEFWKMIEEARRMPTVPLEKVREELFADEPSATENDS